MDGYILIKKKNYNTIGTSAVGWVMSMFSDHNLNTADMGCGTQYSPEEFMFRDTYPKLLVSPIGLL
jgi:hypothetical protein